MYQVKFEEIIEKFPDHEHIFTDGSKSGLGVASAALHRARGKPQRSLTLGLPADTSSYSAEVQALILSLELVYQSQNNQFLIFTDCLPVLQNMADGYLDHPLLQDLDRLHTFLCLKGYDMTFTWVKAHVGIPGNEAVDALAKKAVKENNAVAGA